MNVVVPLSFRFDLTPDGAVWTSTAFSYSFWTRYLDVFDGVRIVARAAAIERPVPDARRVDGASVSFHPVPFYRGPAEYLRKAGAVRRAALAAVGENDAVILRASSQLADCMAPALQRERRPYGVEVVGDPYEAFAPGAVRHTLRPLFRWRLTASLRHQCAAACGVSYVTESSLPSRYPCPLYMAAVSDVELPADWWDAPPASDATFQERRLVFVGSLEQMYKGLDVLLDAMALCRSTEPFLSLSVVGEGRHLPELRRRADLLGIQDRVRFLGRLPAGVAIRDELDRSSLFVLPSRTEGLPRAMLEAMARGLPCLGSAVGGVPELLEPEDLVPAGDSLALSRLIVTVMRDPRRLQRMSQRNVRRAARFREEHLRPRRIEFYRHVAEEARTWLASRTLATLGGDRKCVCST